jgi:hypothetical protein
MDPNANLREQLKLAAKLVGDAGDLLSTAHDAARLAGLVLSLDEWLDMGGFLPEAWRDARGGAGGGGA